MSNNMLGFNPLNVNDSSYFEIIKKREIKNIIKSYAGYFDAFSELIQNAMDATDRKKKNSKGDYKKKIWIKINLVENTFSITDNGSGFKKEEINFFAPNISFKDTDSRGKKGVGASFLAYGFNYIQVGSKNGEVDFLVQLKNGYNWLEGEMDIQAPVFEETELIHQVFDEINEGTTFTLRFGEGNTRPKRLDWINATTANQWVQILKLKTPLGAIFLNEDVKQDERIQVVLEVLDSEGVITEINEEEIYANYLYPHFVIERSKDYREIVGAREKILRKGKKISSISNDFKKLNGIFIELSVNDLLNKSEIIEDLLLNEEDLESIISEDTKETLKDYISQYQINAYGYFGYSRQIWEDFNSETLGLRKGVDILSSGIQLATDNMPQGPLLAIPLSFETGYQYQTHIVIHFKGAEPDLGRKGFQPELTRVAEILSEKILKLLRKFKGDHMKENTGTKSTLLSEEEVSKWIDKQRAHEVNNPLIIKNQKFFLPTNEISITSTPLSEQDVIVLFSQLVAGGIIRGIKVMSTSQVNQYDGIFKYHYNKPQNNHVYEKLENPLGLKERRWKENFESFRDSVNSKEATTSPKILEYKYNLNSLWEDFNNNEKNEKNINLVIAWETGNKWQDKYIVVSYLDLTNLDDRKIHGITHSFHDLYTNELKFNAIILSELIEFLNDIDGVQEKHREKYLYI